MLWAVLNGRGDKIILCFKIKKKSARFSRWLSGAPGNDCFLYNISSEKQILPRIFYYSTTKFLDDRSIHVEFSKLI